MLFAVLALGSLICPVTGQEISGSEVWRSGVGDPVMAVALSEDGLYSPVITERNIYVYDQNATVLWRYPVSHGKGVAVSSDSERIAAAGDHLLLFDREGNIIWRYKPDSRIRDVALTADGRTICTATDAGLRVFSLNKERTVANVSWTFDAKDRIKSVSVDGGGTGIVAGGAAGDVYLLSGDGRLLWTYRTGNSGIKAVISHDGSTVAAASSQQVILLNRNGNLLWKSSVPGRIADVAISRDGSTLLLANGGVAVFNRSGENIWTYATEEGIGSVSAPSASMQFLTGASDGSVSLFVLQPATISCGTPDDTLSNAVTAAAEPSQTRGAPHQGQTTSQQEGKALSPATPVAVVASAAALIWWRRERR
ncbi:MAG: PQQ-binding-like beta-propeller repeat protein [Methanoculleus sp.]|nr:PQQ-binding-like beta-propeller repeat protein [Methanoculleus sp.]